ERRGHIRRRGPGRGGQPCLVLSKQRVDGVEEWRVVLLEVEVEHDQRPRVALVLRERAFHDWTDLVEEVPFERRGAIQLRRVVRDEDLETAARSILSPIEVLLDRDGQASRKRTVDAIGPAVVLRIRIVGVEQHALAWTETLLREPGIREHTDCERSGKT